MADEHERFARELVARIAARIDELRIEHGASVNWLADFSGLDRGYLSRLLRGQANPSVRTLALLATALDVSFAALCRVNEPKRPRPPARPRSRRGN